jgi:hypothetical protein
VNLRRQAKGRGCQVRLPCCNFNSETTVLAHVRLPGISGMGLKSPDLLGAWACSACHEYVDRHHDDETQRAFYEGVLRTQAQLIREGVVKCS